MSGTLNSAMVAAVRSVMTRQRRPWFIGVYAAGPQSRTMWVGSSASRPRGPAPRTVLIDEPDVYAGGTFTTAAAEPASDRAGDDPQIMKQISRLIELRQQSAVPQVIFVPRSICDALAMPRSLGEHVGSAIVAQFGARIIPYTTLTDLLLGLLYHRSRHVGVLSVDGTFRTGLGGDLLDRVCPPRVVEFGRSGMMPR